MSIYEELVVPAGLAGIATRLWQLEATPLHRYEKILPLPNVHLIVNLSDPYRLFGRAGRAAEVVDAFVSGLQRECLVIESPTRIRHVGVELTPAGLHTMAPQHAAASAGAVQDARRLLAGVDALVAQLHAASAPDARLRILAEFLLRASAQPPDRLVDDAVRAIGADLDRTIESIAAELGVSQRTLMARFRAVTGTTPKQHAQVLRFHRFVDAVHTAGGRPDWAALAVSSGYYDQPHVIRAFRRFSGWTPGEYYRLAAEHGPDAAHFVPLAQLPLAAQASA
ncbi:helix-turn-helix domain-containing protein [Agrococcus baldri]|uniref:Transcriptional regulator n=1 Tax=Agrococcus baldri TaxID=153730 RepID=A0AA87RGC9_9MICO|nr:AraC family transcriptional regulator [Agrococcus baldri]GEK80124.1 transcriptional regulator [Agrococcus baldri]